MPLAFKPRMMCGLLGLALSSRGPRQLSASASASGLGSVHGPYTGPPSAVGYRAGMGLSSPGGCPCHAGCAQAPFRRERDGAARSAPFRSYSCDGMRSQRIRVCAAVQVAPILRIPPRKPGDLSGASLTTRTRLLHAVSTWHKLAQRYEPAACAKRSIQPFAFGW